MLLLSHLFIQQLQHASADVEKMVLGNKCDMEDRRQVSKERGEQVGFDVMMYNNDSNNNWIYIAPFH